MDEQFDQIIRFSAIPTYQDIYLLTKQLILHIITFLYN